MREPACFEREPRVRDAEISVDAWQEFLSAELRCPVRVVYTRARRTPIQVRPARAPTRDVRSRAPGAPGASGLAARERSTAASTRAAPDRSSSARGLEVRMHSMFVAAPPAVHAAVASWIRSGNRAPRACALLDEWIHESLERLPKDSRRRVRLEARGRRHDLGAMMRELLVTELGATELGNEIEALPEKPRVTWGKSARSRTRHSLRLGSYDPESAIVRIHPVLDQDGVPDFFVRYVVFHELLHAVLPPRRGEGSRWIHHGREFRRRERAYADYERAIAWEKAHMTELIRSVRRSVPMRASNEVAPAPSPQRSRARESAAPDAPRPPSPPKKRTREPDRETARESASTIARFFQRWLFPE
jgi:hypothetical protein